jgi:tetratricopeptide (TPR) repeat protein
VSNDRAATLRHADELARQGRIDEALAEYQRLADEQPRDWTTANLLGDLLVRAGQTPRAIEHFGRAAEILAADGFAARACAIYKKILKLKPDDDRALVRAGELSQEQGLLVDARRYLGSASDARRRRGDRRGALALVVRLGSLDRDDVETRLRAALALVELENLPGALTALTDLARDLLDDGRGNDALAALREILVLDPADMRAAEAMRLLTAGDVDGTRARLTPVERDDTAILEPAAAASAPVASAPDLSAARASGVAGVATLSHGGAGGSRDSGSADAATHQDASTGDLERVFAELRDRSKAGSPDDAAQVAYVCGTALLEAGERASGIEQLTAAARSPRLRHAAAIRLAEAFQGCGQAEKAVEWLGNALDAPDLTDDVRCDVLRRLAAVLEGQGETERALAAWLELQACAPGDEAAAARVAQLMRGQSGG